MNGNHIIVCILNINILLNIETYTCLGRACDKTISQHQDYIMVILRKQIFKQAVEEIEGKTKILTIFNKYKNTFEDFIDSSNIESSDISKTVDKGLHNIMLSSKNHLIEPKLDENLLDGSKWQLWHYKIAPRAENSTWQPRHDIQILGFKLNGIV